MTKYFTLALATAGILFVGAQDASANKMILSKNKASGSVTGNVTQTLEKKKQSATIAIGSVDAERTGVRKIEMKKNEANGSVDGNITQLLKDKKQRAYIGVGSVSVHNLD